MAAAFSLPSCVRAGASVSYCRRPTTSYLGGGFPTAHACCSKRSRRISTVTVQRDVSPLSPSSDSLSTAAVAKTAGHYIREDYIVEKVTSSQVQELLKGERSVPLVIDFYATWCGPCILMAQELEMLAVEYESNALFVKVDTDDEYEFARDMQVRGLPTLYFISPDPSKDAIRTEGLVPPEMIKNIIDNEM